MADIEKKTTDAEAPAKKAEAKKAKKSDKESVGKRIAGWFRSLKSEMGKISWSSPKSVFHSSLMVIVSIVVVAAVIALLDYVFAAGIVGLNRLI